MRMFECQFVVRIYGVAAASEPLMLVMELVSEWEEMKEREENGQASDGALDSYLKKVSCDEKKKAEMVLQVRERGERERRKGPFSLRGEQSISIRKRSSTEISHPETVSMEMGRLVSLFPF